MPQVTTGADPTAPTSPRGSGRTWSRARGQPGSSRRSPSPREDPRVPLPEGDAGMRGGRRAGLCVCHTSANASSIRVDTPIPLVHHLFEPPVVRTGR